MAQTVSIGKKNTVKVQAPDGSVCEVRQPSARESLALEIMQGDASVSVVEKAEAMFVFMEKLGLPKEMADLCSMQDILEIIEAITPKKKTSLPLNSGSAS